MYTVHKMTLVLIASLLFVCHAAYAQADRLFTVDRQISSSMVNHLYQDSKGYIWVATENGLNKYDGVKFTVYRHDSQDSASLNNNYVKVVYENREGRLLVGTQTGMQEYDYASDTFRSISMYDDEGRLFYPTVSCIIEDGEGRLLAGTSGYGVYVVDTEGTFMRARERFLPQHIYDIVNQMWYDSQGNLWLATETRGIQRVDKDMGFSRYLTDARYHSITSICEDDKGNIYAGIMDDGLFKYDKESDNFVHIPYEKSRSFPVKSLTFNAADGEVLIGTDGKGLKIYDTSTGEIAEANLHVMSLDLSNSKIHTIIKDNFDNLWLGVYQKGVAMLPGKSSNFNYIGHYSTAYNTIGSNCVMSICKDSRDNLWIGTDNDGLYRLAPDGERKAHFSHTSASASVPATVMSIYEDSEQNVWIGSFLNGMARLNPDNGTCRYFPLTDQNGSKAQRVYCFAEDNDKRLWIGTMGNGLFRMDIRSGQVTPIKYQHQAEDFTAESNLLANTWINCLLHSRDNKLYIGTFDGLCCLDISTMDFLNTFGKKQILRANVINCLHEDAQGNVWIGMTGGLAVLNPHTQETAFYSSEDGIPGNSILAIAEDRAGNLWLSTDQGLACCHVQTRKFTPYRTYNGLVNNEYSRGAGYADRNGIIWFGGTNGVTWFDPASISFSIRKPEIRITDLFLQGNKVTKGMKSGKYVVTDTLVSEESEFNLSHQDNSFTFEFTTTDYSMPASYSYSVDNGIWNTLQPGTNRISFSNLSPGRHVLRIRAWINEISSEVKEIKIVIHPAWYASSWAYTAYVIICIACVYLIIRQIQRHYRTKQEILKHIHGEEIKEAKLQFFINISHELKTPMSLIISPLQKLILADSDPQRQKIYSLMKYNTERILSLVNQLMDIRKLDKGQMKLLFQETDLIRFINTLDETFLATAKDKNINFSLISELEELKVWIDPKNFDKVILNLLSNAFKYTPENGAISVAVRKGHDPNPQSAPLADYAEIVVEDNGRGIEEKELKHIFERFYQIRNNASQPNIGTGIGLHLAQSLVTLHHGIIWAENRKDVSGSRFIVRIPLGKDHLSAEEISPETPASLPAQKDEKDLIVPVGLPQDEEKNKRKKKYHILIAEDDEETRKYLRHELEDEFNVYTAPNGKEAFAKLLQEKVHLVISDVVMPEMDGLSLCHKIKQNTNTNHIPIILLTVRNKEEDNIEGLSTGADAYLTKPFNLDILRMTVVNLIKNREMLRNNFSGNQEQESKMQYIKAQSPDEKLMEKVMKVINENISNPELSVEMIAKEVGISRVHLYRKLKELTNQSTRDFIRNCRLKQAASLLMSNKNYNVSEVALLVGFMNISYFSTVFKEFYGVAPVNYAEFCRKQQGTEEKGQA